MNPYRNFIRLTRGGAAGIATTGIDDILGCEEPGVFGLVGRSLERRFEALKLKETIFTLAGIELSKAKDSSVVAPRGKFTDEIQPMPNPPAPRTSRQRPLYGGDSQLSMHVGRTCLACDCVATRYL